MQNDHRGASETRDMAGFCGRASSSAMMTKPEGHQSPTNIETAVPPSQRLHLILLGVSDVARSRSFYEALGWHISPSSDDGFVRIDLGGYALCLLDRSLFSSEVFGREVLPQGTYSGIALAHLVKTPEAVGNTLAHALQAGAELVKPVTRTPWGINAFFKDLDGHLFEIDYEEAWQFDGQHRLL